MSDLTLASPHPEAGDTVNLAPQQAEGWVRGEVSDVAPTRHGGRFLLRVEESTADRYIEGVSYVVGVRRGDWTVVDESARS